MPKHSSRAKDGIGKAKKGRAEMNPALPKTRILTIKGRVKRLKGNA